MFTRFPYSLDHVPGMHVWDFHFGEWIDFDSARPIDGTTGSRFVIVFAGETLEYLWKKKAEEKLSSGHSSSSKATLGDEGVHPVRPHAVLQAGIHEVSVRGSRPRFSAPFQLLAEPSVMVDSRKTARQFVEELSSKRISSNFPR